MLSILEGLRIAPLVPRHQTRKQNNSLPSQRSPTPFRIAATSSSSSNHDDGMSPTQAPVPKVGWLWDRSSRPLNRQTLREQNIRPKKSLGQNFMMDDDVLVEITKAAALTPGAPVLEIGPGTGALTTHLLETGAAITAVEKDRSLFERLEIEYEAAETLQLVCADILRLNFPELLDGMLLKNNDNSSSRQHSQKVQVVANLPYYITKDFLVRALPEGGKVSRLLLMLQDEVGIRLTAKDPGGADWRAMNIIVHYYSEPRYLFKIDRKKYVPSPKVHGAVVEFRLRKPEERLAVPDERTFISLVKKSFMQRRKALRNSLQPLVSSAEAVMALEAVGLQADSRAQELTLEDFVKLAWEIEKVKKGVAGADGEDGAEESAAE